jgi:predicted dehydrogenase
MNVALIGLGNISVLYDYDRYSRTVLSHIKGIYKNGLNLKYIVDINISNVAKVRRFFPKVKYIKNFQELREKKDIDILVIATPTFTHCNILKKFVNNKNIKLFFVEKPLFKNKCKIKKQF